MLRYPIWFTLYFFFVWSLFFVGILAAASYSGVFLAQNGARVAVTIGLFAVLLGYNEYVRWLVGRACSENRRAVFVLLSYATIVVSGFFAGFLGQDDAIGRACYVVGGLCAPFIIMAVFVQFLVLADDKPARIDKDK